MATRFVIDRTDEGEPVRPLSELRQVFTDIDTWHGSRDRFELTANFSRRFRLHVVHVLRRRSTEQEHKDDILGFGPVDRTGVFRREHLRQSKPA